MARILVLSDGPLTLNTTLHDEADRVLYAEEVKPVHLDDQHQAGQFIDRLRWAMRDAEFDAEVK